MKLLLIFLTLPLIGTAQVDLVKTTLLGGKVELLVPKQLTAMTDDMWNFKYHLKTKPTLVLTDANAEVNFIVSATQLPLQEAQMEEYTNMHMANLQKSRPDLKILSKSVKKVNGKNVGYCKFVIQASDQAVFNYYFFIIVDGKLLYFTFNCIEKLQDTWEKYADQIVESLKVN